MEDLSESIVGMSDGFALGEDVKFHLTTDIHAYDGVLTRHPSHRYGFRYDNLRA